MSPRKGKSKKTKTAEGAEVVESVSPRGRKGPRWKRWLVAAVLLAVLLPILGLVTMLGIRQHMRSTAAPQMFASAEELPVGQGDVALVLGARILARGELSAMLQDRVETAVALYRAGKVKKLLMSGDNSEIYYNEPTAMRRVAIAMGVPADDVVRDFAGFSTYDSMYRARDVFGQSRVVIVTQEFHLPRAIYIARSLGLQAVGVIADRRTYTARSMRRSNLREVGACALAFFETNFTRPKPRYLGARESLSGIKQRAQDDP